MLELFNSGLLAVWLGLAEPQTLNSTHLSSWLESSQPRLLGDPVLVPDAAAVAAVATHLGRLSALGLPVTEHGVWIQVGNEVLAEHQGTTPLPAASLTKIATTLAALTVWDINHRFDTVISTDGTVQGGVLQGNLIVQGSGDPFFVWEEAIALGNALQQAGINRVTGDLVISGNFAMNFETNPATAGALLKQGLNAASWNSEATAQFLEMPAGTARPTLMIDGSVRVVSGVAEGSVTPLVQHQSLTLAQILKGMNTYSNNAMSEMLATALGGGAAVAQTAATAAGVPPTEIRLINGSGLGEENQISPRAVSAMLMTIQSKLRPHQLNVADLFPVAGQDRGTLGSRRIPNASAVKTGTLDAVSSLAGVIPTRDRGLVYFAIINLGTGDLASLHDEQDLLLQQLVSAWGETSAASLEMMPGDRSRNLNQELGNPARNTLL